MAGGGIYFGGATNDPSFPVTPGAYKSTCCPPGPFGIRNAEGFAGKLSSDLEVNLRWLGEEAHLPKWVGRGRAEIGRLSRLGKVQVQLVGIGMQCCIPGKGGKWPWTDLRELRSSA